MGAPPNGKTAVRAPQAAAPFQGRGFTAEEREWVRYRFSQDYGGEMAGARAVLRAFANDAAIRDLILTASRPFTDPTRRHRPDKEFGGAGVPTLFVEGFGVTERDRIRRALSKTYLTVSQGVRSVALAYATSDSVRRSVQRLIPPPQVGG